MKYILFGTGDYYKRFCHWFKYRDVVAKHDGKLLSFVNNGYDVTHLYMGYDGVTDKKICDRGFEIANHIINHCAMMLPKPACA